MHVSLIQCAPEPGGIEATLEKIGNLTGQGTGADLYVLPEMFATGQCLNPETVAQYMDGSIVTWMRTMSANLEAAVAGSVAICENGKYYNRFCFVKPDGDVVCYDKRHLFTYSGEGRYFSHGNDRVVTEFRGVRILLQVCYDLRFPVFARNNDDYDLAIYVANWPIARQNSWDVFLRSRAMENQCFVAGVNRVGDDEYGHYDGHTAFISPYGETLAAAADNEEQIVTGFADMDRLVHFRTKFPVMQDADLFELRKN